MQRLLIRQQKAEWKRPIIFLGAHIDAIDVGGSMGVGADTSITYYDSGYATARSPCG